MHVLSPLDLKSQWPLSDQEKKFIAQSRKAIQNIFDKKDSRFLLIVGPCSIHRVEEGLEYAKLLKELSEQVKDTCFVVMRAYIEKPRTREGWKGLVHDPHLDGSCDIQEGLALVRNFLVDLAQKEIPVATEILNPFILPYIEDLISWGCIGARTSSSQIHRVIASHVSIPVGFKNSVDGNIDCAIDGVVVARGSHQFLHISERGHLIQVKSGGNPYGHVVLRGSHAASNYDPLSIQKVFSLLQKEELPPRILVDCSHGNSRGQYWKQKEVFQSILDQIQNQNSGIFGVMIESNLREGAQKIPSSLSQLQRGVSVTDACLDFRSTAELIESLSSSISMSLTQS